MGWELDDVEKPFIAQLKGLAWTYMDGALDDAALAGRIRVSSPVSKGSFVHG